MDFPDVRLFFRKSRPGGNFSIEASFETMLLVFPKVMGYTPQTLEAPTYSNGIWPRVQIALAARRGRHRINHITGDVHFAALALPRRGTILTVHDCGFMRHPNPWLRRFLWLFWLKLPVAHAQVVTAISEATKAELIHFTGCNPAKIRVIPTIIKTHFNAQPKAFQVSKPRILHIGNAPNKNLLRHIEALRGIECTFHIIGKISAEVQSRLQDSQIDYFNEYDLTDAQVQAAYHQCDLLLFASTLEGFGMPILEAQTVGRPVVTSNLSSMPEVAGTAACLVDPLSVASIRDGVQRVINDAPYREGLIAAGFENVKRFQAETVARAYGEVYRVMSGE
ncbi:glycosyltransferase family 4 protein [Haliscomenobacter sp.]|uniref:glycosyltransferase family 4 protein n=1 Tax=Haliscomenobacter sp. TaxID=2717303 RepID=UPI00359403B1